MNHTIETLLPLLDTPEGLEKLRVITAEADGWTLLESKTFNGHPVYLSHEGKEAALKVCGNDLNKGIDFLPNYTLSLDAIFDAEKRLGLHEDRGHLRNYWIEQAGRMIDQVWWENQIAFLTPAQRCIPFILTAQSLKP